MRPRLLDLALVLTGGALYAAAFPPYGQDASAWIALVPLLAVLSRASAGGAFLAGAAYGAVFFAAVVPWVVGAVAAYFSAGVVAATAFGALICALFVSGWVGLFAVAARTLLRRGRWQAFLGIPALWVAYELARATLLTGLPWELLGHSQWQRLSLIQVADLGGVYALSFVIAAVNVGIYLVVRTATRTARPRRLARAAAPLAVALALVASCVVYGDWRIARTTETSPQDTAILALAQGDLPASWRWERSNAERNLLAYVGLSRRAIAESHPDLLIWPEYAVTLYPERDAGLLTALRELAHRTPAGLIFGAPRVVEEPSHTRYFNSAYHIATTGSVTAYDKIRLVPFAEYRPLTFDEALAADSDGDFSAGVESTVFPTAVGRLGVLICYEVIFPDLARRLTRAGAEILVNLSNDGWLDRAGLGAGTQHLSIAVFRAVENHRFVARAAASGISGFIDPVGRPFGMLDADRSGVAIGEVSARRDLSLYTRIGDAFGVACALLGLALVPPRRRARRDA
jgi:apolipoprotein N-acyltransferase